MTCARSVRCPFKQLVGHSHLAASAEREGKIYIWQCIHIYISPYLYLYVYIYIHTDTYICMYEEMDIHAQVECRHGTCSADANVEATRLRQHDV